jgi:DNA/RNA endonuclease YhcR with UshA esterase domain
MKKFYLVAILISLIGILTLCLIATTQKPQFKPISQISSEDIGRLITTEGKIIYKKIHPSGHIFLTLKEGDKTIQVPLFKSFLQNSIFKHVYFKFGQKIRVTGVVDEYNGILQIIPREESDVKIYD